MNTGKLKLGIWSAIGGAVLTMVIGFSVGGWVLGGTSLKDGKEMAREAVTDRLAPLCLAQFNLDPEKEQKYQEMVGMSFWEKTGYIEEQGWSTIPFESESDNQVARKCSSLIMERI